MEIFELSDKKELLDDAVNYFWKCWGSSTNYAFYKDCIINSLSQENRLPKFYIGIVDNQIIASYALLTNDIISRQDLMPWFACLFVNPEFRKLGYAGLLLEHGATEAKKKGFKNFYLATDLENFYERKGGNYFTEGYNVSGEGLKVYIKSTE
ncbi:MAG: GNAT family N-acetyltransferase [Aureispira sp.]|nr:GNAT family N-acetyltransferase [Aureispira sp.]